MRIYETVLAVLTEHNEGVPENFRLPDDELRLLADVAGGMVGLSPQEIWEPEGVSPAFTYACWIVAQILPQQDTEPTPQVLAWRTAQVAMRAYARKRAA